MREVLVNTVDITTRREDYVNVSSLDADSAFFEYQRRVNVPLENVMSHRVIEDYIARFGQDYRFETSPNPIRSLQNRSLDNTDVGRSPQTALSGAR